MTERRLAALVAFLIAGCVTAVTIRYTTFVPWGTDSASYVTAARQWANANLFLPAPFQLWGLPWTALAIPLGARPGSVVGTEVSVLTRRVSHSCWRLAISSIRSWACTSSRPSWPVCSCGRPSCWPTAGGPMGGRPRRSADGSQPHRTRARRHRDERRAGGGVSPVGDRNRYARIGGECGNRRRGADRRGDDAADSGAVRHRARRTRPHGRDSWVARVAAVAVGSCRAVLSPVRRSARRS